MPQFTGTDAGERFDGSTDADTMEGAAGADTLFGDAGDDQLFGGFSRSTNNPTGDDLIDGGRGRDFINGHDGSDTLRGGDDRDIIFGSSGPDWLSGDAGDDDVNGDLGDLYVDGGEGNDSLTISGPPQGEAVRLSRVTGGPGDDRFTLIDLVPTTLLLEGGAGANTLRAAWNTFRLPTEVIDVHLNQPYAGPGVTALGFASFTAEVASMRVFGSDIAETISTSGLNDYIEGGAGDDVLYDSGNGYGPGSPQETVLGGLGDDRIYVGGGLHYLRGDEGADSVSGGGEFDDINGNMGNDTLDGRFGDDWVVGGKDNDQLQGGGGNDLVYGNLGRDFCEGGEGNDTVRGGQEDDWLSGGDGNDFLSGDRGADTVQGGSGADIFHAFQEAGLDRVKDFSQVQGDRVTLDPGTTYTVSQVGTDTVIDFGGGHQMILEGVALANLRDGWISGGATPAPSSPVGPPTVLPGFAPANLIGWDYDPTRGLVYVASSDGVVRSWNFLTNTSQIVANVGGKPSSLAVTPDGRYLVIGDSETVVPPGGPGGFNDPRQGGVIRYDLQTGTSTKLNITVRNGERGSTDVAVTADGLAYVNHGFTDPAFLAFSSFDATAATPTLARALAPYSLDRNMALSVSETGRYLLIMDTGSSAGGFLVVDSTTDQLVPRSIDGVSPVRNFNTGAGDISEAAAQIVQVQTTGIYVWNLGPTITFAADLTGFTAPGELSTSNARVLGAHFSANGQFLYLWDAYQDAILAVDCSTWTAVGSVQVKADARFDYFSTHQGDMELTPDGRYLILDTGTSLEVIDLATQLSIRRTGTEAGERLNGDVGRDTLDGAAGADTLVGYGGDDVLIGGAGADVFHASARGGVDRVTDFDRAQGDRVRLDPGLSHTLAQVGADTVVTTAGGGQMVLVGVQMNTLTPGWIFEG